MIRFDRNDKFVTLNDRPILTSEFGLPTHVRRDWAIVNGASFELPKEEVKKHTYGFHGYGSFFYAMLSAQGRYLSYLDLGDSVFEDTTEKGEILYSCGNTVAFRYGIDFSKELQATIRTLVLRYAISEDWFSENLRKYLVQGEVFSYERALQDLVAVMAKDGIEPNLLKVALFTFFEGEAMDTLVFCVNALLGYVEEAFGELAKVIVLNDLEAMLESRAREKGVIPDDFVPVLWG